MTMLAGGLSRQAQGRGMLESTRPFSFLSRSGGTSMEHELIAAVDLGSNSFRLQVARSENGQIYPLDGLKESVRLAAGLTSDKYLDLASQQRALQALARFGEIEEHTSEL